MTSCSSSRGCEGVDVWRLLCTSCLISKFSCLMGFNAIKILYPIVLCYIISIKIKAMFVCFKISIKMFLFTIGRYHFFHNMHNICTYFYRLLKLQNNVYNGINSAVNFIQKCTSLKTSFRWRI